MAGKYRGSRYIAYFQAYTNTYAPEEQLRALFTPVVEREDIAVLSVATGRTVCRRRFWTCWGS